MSGLSKFPPAPILCWVTDRRRTRGRKLVDIAQEVVDGGFNMIRIREPDLGEDALEALIEQLKDITRGKAILMSNWRSSDNLWKHSNVGVYFYNETIYNWAKENITTLIIKKHLNEIVKGEVIRYELYNIFALNFIFINFRKSQYMNIFKSLSNNKKSISYYVTE